MNIFKKIRLFFMIGLLCGHFFWLGARPTLALIDTADGEAYLYEPFLTLSLATGFDTRYIPLSDALSLSKHDLEKFDAAFFVFHQEFIVALNSQKVRSAVLQGVMECLGMYSQMSGKLLGMLVPSIGFPEVYAPLFRHINFPQSPTNDEAIKVISAFLRFPPETRPLRYATALLPAHGGKEAPFYAGADLATMPERKNDSSPLSSLLPLGVYFHNKEAKNHLFVGFMSPFVAAGISENFKIMPLDPALQTKLYGAVQDCLSELAHRAGIAAGKVQAIDRVQASLGGGMARRKAARSKLKYAWMGTEFFGDDTKLEEQKKLIDYIYEAGLTHLWLTLAPNWYYSPRAKKAAQKEQLLEQVASFMHALKDGARERKMKAPRLLIGFEIVNNFGNLPGGQDLPTNKASDIFGTTYYDVPAPLDAQFWKDEVTDSLDRFLADWAEYKKKNKFYDDLGFEGVVIDFEMYNRKTTGAFFPTMGYEPALLAEYAHDKCLCPSLDVAGLLKNKQLYDYRLFLQKKAYLQGVAIRDAIRSRLPGAIIGAYAPAIQASWPYKQFFQGFDNGDSDKFHLFTFNTRFFVHKPWLCKNNIRMRHVSALMLSKVGSLEDMNLAQSILKAHDGIWLNRLQWSVLPHSPTEWFSLEQSPLSPVLIRDAFRRLKGF